MKKVRILGLILVLLFLSACSGNNSDIIESNQNTNTHLVDERFELIALVLRLTEQGGHFFRPDTTDFHQRLDYTFGDFYEHPAVRFVRRWGLSMDAALNVAIHLDKIDDTFAFVENIENLGAGYVRWLENSLIATSFLNYLNSFYEETNFAVFFQEHYEYFAEHSKRFKKEVYSQINFEWFKQHGLNSDNMHVILSPSNGDLGVATQRYGHDGKIVYAAVPTSSNYSIPQYGYLLWVIHEFVHSFANPIADTWLLENSEFNKWVNASYHSQRILIAHHVQQVAQEYVTRAYTILYMIENTEANLINMLLSDILAGYSHIQEVFALITDHEIIDFSLSALFGIYEYHLSEEQTHDFGDSTIKWHFLDLLGYELLLDNFVPNTWHNMFGSQTGQAMYVFYGDSKFLFIDLGTAEGFDWQAEEHEADEARAYFVKPIF